MPKLQKVGVPAIQVIFVLIVFSMSKFCHDEYLRVTFVAPASEILVRLNFPLACLWFLPFYALERMNNYVPQWNTIMLYITTALTAALMIASVAAFWYFATVEFNLRRHGTSKMRSSNFALELSKNVVLAAIAVAALVYAYTGWSYPAFVRNSYAVILDELILIGWATVLFFLLWDDMHSYIRVHHRRGSIEAT